jgi:RHS repeat-associated protein
MDDILFVGSTGISVYFAGAGGSFVQRDLSTNSAISDAVAFDIDDDGDQDVLASFKDQSRIIVFKQTSNRSFDSGTSVNLAAPVTSIGFGKLDSDTDTDIVVGITNGSGASSLVFLNNTAGAFSVETTASVAGAPITDIRVADFDNDGKADFLTTQSASSAGTEAKVLWGSAPFAFSATSPIGKPASGSEIEVADIDGDSDLDFIIPGYEGQAGYLVIRENLGGRGLETRPTQRVSNLQGVRLIDLDGDGNKEFLTTTADSTQTPMDPAYRMELKFGSGNESYGNVSHVDLPTNLIDTFFGDFDGDGKLDFGRVHGLDQELELQYSFVESLFGRTGTGDDAVTRYTYTPRGQVDTVTDPLGRVTDYDYDSLGRLVSQTSAKGTSDERIIRYEYNPATTAGKSGFITAMIDGNGNRTAYEYDAMNRLVKTIEADPDGAGPLSSPVSQLRYDVQGNVVESVDPNGATSRFDYDVRDRLISSTSPDPDGASGPEFVPTTRIAYDGNGNTKSVTDPLGKTTRYEYNARNQQTKSIDASGAITNFEYDRFGNMSTLTDPVGNRTVFDYDSRQRLIVETDPLGKKIQYSYDAANNLIQKIDRNDRPTLYTYDDQNRLVTEKWVGPNGEAVNTIRYTYDKVGNPLTITDNYSALTNTYDSLNRIKSVDNNGTPDATRVVLTYTYDNNGNILSVDDTISGAPGASTTYQYDALDRLSVLTQSGPEVAAKRVNFAYNQIGQYTAIDRYSDLDGTQLVIATDYVYDSINRLTAIDHRNTAGAAVSFFRLKYDLADRVKSIVDVDGIVEYSYDSQNQLTSASYTKPAINNEIYHYDGNGNRTQSSISNNGYLTGPGNRLLSDGTYAYEYDDEGNTVKRIRLNGTEADGTVLRIFAWDHRNRLTSVIDKRIDESIALEIAFEYDAIDRRIARDSIYDPGDGSNGARTYFSYDREDIFIDFVESQIDGEYSISAARRYLHGPKIDNVLAMENEGKLTWLLSDHLQTTRDYVNATGTLETHLQYDTFGNILSISGSGNISRYGLSGREFDQQIGLYYYRTRYYSSNTGRFLSEDWLRFESQEFNLYRFVSNSPIDRVDPYGTQDIPTKLWEKLYDLGTIFGNTASEGRFRRLANISADIVKAANAGKTYKSMTESNLDFIALQSLKSIFSLQSEILQLNQALRAIDEMNFGCDGNMADFYRKHRDVLQKEVNHKFREKEELRRLYNDLWLLGADPDRVV